MAASKPSKPSKPSKAPSSASAPASTNLSARLPQQLVESVKRLSSEAGESTSDFLKSAIENEVSRRSLCKPQRPISLEDVKRQLDQINEIMARSEAADRQTAATLKVISTAMGVDIDNE